MKFINNGITAPEKYQTKCLKKELCPDLFFNSVAGFQQF